MAELSTARLLFLVILFLSVVWMAHGKGTPLPLCQLSCDAFLQEGENGMSKSCQIGKDCAENGVEGSISCKALFVYPIKEKWVNKIRQPGCVCTAPCPTLSLAQIQSPPPKGHKSPPPPPPKGHKSPPPPPPPPKGHKSPPPPPPKGRKIPPPPPPKGNKSPPPPPPKGRKSPPPPHRKPPL